MQYQNYFNSGKYTPSHASIVNARERTWTPRWPIKCIDQEPILVLQTAGSIHYLDGNLVYYVFPWFSEYTLEKQSAKNTGRFRLFNGRPGVSKLGDSRWIRKIWHNWITWISKEVDFTNSVSRALSWHWFDPTVVRHIFQLAQCGCRLWVRPQTKS